MARPRPPRPKGRAKKMTTIAGEISYLDVPLLERYLTDRGRIRARHQTGLSRRQQAEVSRAIKRARELALLPYQREDPRRRGAGPDDAAVAGRRTLSDTELDLGEGGWLSLPDPFDPWGGLETAA